MPFHVYILYSLSADQYYIGSTENLANRIFRHNNSGSKSTKKANDWKLKYVVSFETRALAVQEENRIKAKKSRRYIEMLISTAD